MSQFDSLFKTTAEKKTQNESAKKEVKKKSDTSPLPAVKPAPVKTEKSKTGKSSNPDYTQVLTYIQRGTHNQVKAALIFDDQKRDLSDLVEELLAGWVEKNSR